MVGWWESQLFPIFKKMDSPTEDDDNMSVSTISINHLNQEQALAPARPGGRRTFEEEMAIKNAKLKKAADYDDRQYALSLMANCNMMMLHECLNFEQLAQKLRTLNISQPDIQRLMNGLDLVKSDTRREHKELLATHRVVRKVICETAKNCD